MLAALHFLNSVNPLVNVSTVGRPMDLVKDSVFNHKFGLESDLIDVKNYFHEYSSAISNFEKCSNENCEVLKSCGKDDCVTDEFYRNFLGITQNELNELKERTSIENLRCDDEVDYDKKLPVNIFEDVEPQKIEEPKSPLISVNKRLEMIQITKLHFPRTFYKYCNYEWCISNEKPVTNKTDFSILQFPTIVACVKVYHPFVSHKNKLHKIKLLQEIHILGDQTLAQLKDKIICTLDYIGDRDVSNEWFLKDVGFNITAKDEYPSSFIFIEDTFFNDTRSENLKDLTKELRQWASERKLGDFKTAKMEDTKICNLKLKIGRPYVYQHQGNCEHIILFSDIRLLDSSDSPRYTSYPKIHCTGRIYGKHCMMCTDFYARWLVVGNERLTHEKAYLCNKCFVSYNYIDGQKIGNFQAFKYVDPVAIL